MTVNIDWDNLGFGIVPTKTMYLAKTSAGHDWAEGEYLPYGDLTLSPASGVLNYGQGIYEGLKAYRTKKDEIVLFRPDQNAKRLATGAKRLCMPVVPEAQFVTAVKNIAKQNEAFIPPYGKGALYIRPLMIGSGAILGLAPAPEYTFLIYSSPVGLYFKNEGMESIKLSVCLDYHRAAPKGMGDIKYIGNYAGEVYFSQRAKKLGYNGCLYLDARNEKMVEEAGAANFFCVIGNKLITPNLGSILPGVTRASLLKIAEDFLGMTVEERDLPIEEVLTADECFCTGTAAVVAPIGTLEYHGTEYLFNDGKVGSVTTKLCQLLTQLQLKEIDDPYDWVVTL